jgi:hypothetical protein
MTSSCLNRPVTFQQQVAAVAALQPPPRGTFVNAVGAGAGILLAVPLAIFFAAYVLPFVLAMIVIFGAVPAYLIVLAHISFRFAQRYPSVKPITWMTLLNGLLIIISFAIPGIWALLTLVIPCVMSLLSADAGRRQGIQDLGLGLSGP